MSIEMDVISPNLRHYRKVNDFSKSQLAKMVGISENKYKKIESGVLEVSAGDLYNLSIALNVRFYKLMRPIRNLRTVRFRSNQNLNGRNRILLNVEQWLEDFDAIEELLDDRIPFKFTSISKKFEGSSGNGVSAARMVRESLGLGQEQPIVNICKLLEDSGVKVGEQVVTTPGFYGLSVGKPDGGPAIVINTFSQIPVERWIYTAAHELGHIILHQTDFDVSKTMEEENHEIEADEFALEFLMPKEYFMKEWEKTSGLAIIDRVWELKQAFRVGYLNVLQRLEGNYFDIESISSQFYTDYGMRHRKTLYHSDEPMPLSSSVFRSCFSNKNLKGASGNLLRVEIVNNRLLCLVKKALERDIISVGRGAEILKLTRTDMRKLLNSWVE